MSSTQLSAYILTCTERYPVFEQTLRNLAGTDWDCPPVVVRDEADGRSNTERVESALLKVLERALADGSESFLVMEDDLDFNRHLAQNLRSWPPLRRLEPAGHFFASLYNPGVRELRLHWEDAYFVADPPSVYGSQAFIVSRATADFIVRKWWEMGGLQDIKLTRLAAQITPLLYHVPSLVQHLGDRSAWGGKFHQAADYDPDWKPGSGQAIAGARPLRGGRNDGRRRSPTGSRPPGSPTVARMPGLTLKTARARLEERTQSPVEDPPAAVPAGVVIPVREPRALPGAWVAICSLRELGCSLPIELWHREGDELPTRLTPSLERRGVTVVCADQHRARRGVDRSTGFDLKTYAIVHCAFRHVVVLDADRVPLSDPALLLATPEYLSAGALFWPELRPGAAWLAPRWGPAHPLWDLVGLAPREAPELDTGQICVDKRRHLRILDLALWFGEHGDFWYRIVQGERDAFRIAWLKIGGAYAMPRRAPERIDGVAVQHFDLAGRPFVHQRTLHQFRLDGTDLSLPGFAGSERCGAFLAELRTLLLTGGTEWSRNEELERGRWLLTVPGRGTTLLRFRAGGLLDPAGPDSTRYWGASGGRLELFDELFVPRLRLRPASSGRSFIGVDRSGLSLLALDSGDQRAGACV